MPKDMSSENNCDDPANFPHRGGRAPGAGEAGSYRHMIGHDSGTGVNRQRTRRAGRPSGPGDAANGARTPRWPRRAGGS